ncbi:MAG TPA: energy transducer TonB [Vicinamibacterales bacterium]|nr:energy transducer TonB [Vicinamibacterales bacterium]
MKVLVIAAMVMVAVTPLAAQTPSFAPAPVAGGRDARSIEAARELYASARYDEALALLNGLTPTDAMPADRKLIEQYRSLCLLALGRGEEAEAAIAAVVRVDPFYQPSEAEASPRVRATFADVRQRLLPDLASARYAEAKQAYDRKAYVEAEAGFRDLVALLGDPQMNGRLPDMRTLAAGFVELARAAAAPPSPKAETPAPAVGAAEPPPSAEPPIYTAEEPGIVPPVILRQDVPTVPSAITGMTRSAGVLDLVIDEKGRVISISIRSRIHPVYDTALVNAARDWKYKPAKLNGSPVRFRKLLQISIKR